MKALILLLAIGAAIALRPNTEYTYKYETQVLTGVPHHGLQFAGVKVDAVVKVVTSTDDTVTAKIETVKILKIQTELPDSTIESDMLPESAMTPLDSAVVTEMEAELTKPVQFSYRNGKVDNVRMDPSEPLYSVNLKKGLIAKFMLTLSTTGADDVEILGAFKERERDAIFQLREESVRDRLEQDAIMYKTLEADPTGICETVYSAKHVGNTIRVTKVKNLHSCVKAPVHEQGILTTLTMAPETNEPQDTIEKKVKADYTVEGTPSSFIIKKARTYSRYRFTPLSAEDGSATTTITQRLVLTNARASSGVAVAVGPLAARPEGLLYAFPGTKSTIKTEDIRWGHYGIESAPLSTAELMSAAETLLDELISQTAGRVTPEAVVVAKEVSQLLRAMSVEQLETLCEQHITSPAATTKKGEIILDVIPTLTAPKAVKVMAKLIKTRRVTSIRAIMSLKVMAFTTSPDADLVATLTNPTHPEFLATNIPAEISTVKGTAIMTAAILKSRWLKQVKNTEAITISDALEKVDEDSQAKAWSAMYRRATSIGEKVSVMKAIANIGSPRLLEILAGVATSKAEPEFIRRNAVLGLNKVLEVTGLKKTAITKAMLTVYTDLSEAANLRISAFVALMDSRPAPSVLELIVSTHMEEVSKQVGSFVYSYLKTLAGAEMPGLMSTARNVTNILDVVLPFRTCPLTDSKAYYFDTYSKNKKLGAAVELIKVNGEQSAVPSTIVARVKLHALRKTIPAINVGAYTSGVDAILFKLLGAHTRFTGESLRDKSLREIINAILIPLQSGTVDLEYITDEVKAIIQKLGITDRALMDKINVGLWVQLFGTELSVVHITADDIIDALKAGRLPVIGNVMEMIEALARGTTIDMIRVLNPSTSTVQYPTVAGIPVSLNLTGTAVLRTSGDVSMTPGSTRDVMGYVSRGIDTEVGVTASIKNSVSWAWVATFGADFFPLKTGVSLKGEGSSYVPAAVSVKVNTATKKLTTSLELTDEAEPLDVKITPMTFVTEVDPSRLVKNRRTSVRVLSHPRIALADVTVPSITIPSMNMKIVQKYLNPSATPAWMPVSWVFSPSTMTIAVTPIRRATPVDYELSVTTSTDNYGQISPAEMRRHTVFAETAGTMSVTIRGALGPRGSTQKASSSLTVVTKPDMWTSQVYADVVVPGVANVFKFDGMFNLEALAPTRHGRLSVSKPAADLAVTVAGKHVRAEFFPASPEQKMSWNRVTQNNFYSAVELFTESAISAQIVGSTPAERVTEMNYNFKIETNIASEDISTTAAAIATIATTLITSKLPIGLISTYQWKINQRPGAIVGQLRLQPFYQNVDVSVVTPSGWQYAANVPVNIYTPASHLISMLSPMYNRLPDNVSAAFYDNYNIAAATFTGVCTVHPHPAGTSDLVETFDGLNYDLGRLPETCEVVLAKDCSAYSLFTVVMKASPSVKVIKAYVPGHKIEIVPETSWLTRSTGVRVIVDGATVTATEATPAVLTEAGSAPYAEVFRTGEWVTVRSAKTGLTISTNGKIVNVKTSPLMSKVTCGICGNFNRDPIDEYEGPDTLPRSSARHMVSSYVVPSATCNARTVADELGIAGQITGCDTVRRTYVTRRGSDVCFSTAPIAQCPSGCTIADSTRVDVDLVCREKNAVNTINLMERSRVSPITGFESEEIAVTQTIEVPIACVPTY